LGLLVKAKRLTVHNEKCLPYSESKQRTQAVGGARKSHCSGMLSDHKYQDMKRTALGRRDGIPRNSSGEGGGGGIPVSLCGVV